MIFAGERWGSSGYFRVFGYGVSWRDGRREPLCFAERNGLVRWIRVGRWILRWLPRNPKPLSLRRGGR